MFSVLVIRLRSLRLLRVSGIVMRLRMFLLLITFLKASHSFRNRLLVICKNAYLFATMIMTSVSYVWFLLPRVARLMIHTPTAISIFVCLSMVQLMAVFISMRCTLCGHFLQVALTLILVVGYAIAAS